MLGQKIDEESGKVTSHRVSHRGAVYYQSASPKWTRLNSVAGVFEYEVDAQGNTRSQLYEWK